MCSLTRYVRMFAMYDRDVRLAVPRDWMTVNVFIIEAKFGHASNKTIDNIIFSLLFNINFNKTIRS